MRDFIDHRDYVGPPERYPLVGIAYRDLLDSILPTWCDGLLLDVGCGGLRIGKELMPRMQWATYCGIEPFFPVVEEALRREHGGRIEELFCPHFSKSDQFDLSFFQVHFPVIISYAVFIHCGRAQLRMFLNNIRNHVDYHAKPTSLVVDLRVEDAPNENKPQLSDTAYPHASHDLTIYTEDEVSEMLTYYGARLISKDNRLWCDGNGTRSQHLVVFDVSPNQSSAHE